MRRRTNSGRWVQAGLLALTLALVLTTGCLSRGGGSDELFIAGSTTALPVVQAAADAYMDDHRVNIVVSGGGSSVGVQSAAEGTADVGMASRDLKSSETAEHPDLVLTAIANDGIAVIVNKANPLSDLPIETIMGIYTGDITRWDQVGWASGGNIVTVGRDSASGTRASFEELVLDGGVPIPRMLELNSNNLVYETVAGNEQAIGYLGLSYLDGGVKELAVDGVMPTAANISSGEYPVARKLYLITDGEPSGLAAEFVDFILSERGQELVAREGFLPIGDGEAGNGGPASVPAQNDEARRGGA